MFKSIYHVAKMDCPSEESIIRLKFEDLNSIRKLVFDLEKRELTIYHSSKDPNIEKRLNALNLGQHLQGITEITDDNSLNIESVTARSQTRLLWIVLLINFGFFSIESIAGFISGSMGLIADSLDMLADALVYGLSLWAVGSIVARKKKVATMSGYFQLTLALLGLIEIVRRFIGVEGVPDFKTMIIVSVLALVANSICLYLLQKSKSEEAHMKASMIFTSNDVIINAGIIIAGILVLITQSKFPDLIIGSIVFLVVVRGALRILNLGK